MKHSAFLLIAALVLAGGCWIYTFQRAALVDAQTALARRAASLGGSPVAPLRSSPASPESHPSTELLRLRGEVGVLRRDLANRDPQESAPRQFSNDWQAVYSGVRPSQQPGFLYFTNLTDVGTATPEAALQTFHYAMGNQTKQPLTPTRMKDLWDVPDDFDQQPGYSIDLGEGFYGGSGYRIVQREFLSPDSVRLTIDFEKEDGSSYRRDKILVLNSGRWRIKPVAVKRASPEN